MTFRNLCTTTLLAAAWTLPAAAQQNIQPANAASTPAGTAQTFTNEQILTATVHQAWLLSGKNEDNFFAIVQQLAAISAKNRDLTLPDSAAAGRRMGNYIKTLSKTDTDQLLYAVVDKAVVMATHAPAHPARSATKAAPTN